MAKIKKKNKTKKKKKTAKQLQSRRRFVRTRWHHLTNRNVVIMVNVSSIQSFSGIASKLHRKSADMSVNGVTKFLTLHPERADERKYPYIYNSQNSAFRHNLWKITIWNIRFTWAKPLHYWSKWLKRQFRNGLSSCMTVGTFDLYVKFYPATLCKFLSILKIRPQKEITNQTD